MSENKEHKIIMDREILASSDFIGSAVKHILKLYTEEKRSSCCPACWLHS